MIFWFSLIATLRSPLELNLLYGNDDGAVVGGELGEAVEAEDVGEAVGENCHCSGSLQEKEEY